MTPSAASDDLEHADGCRCAACEREAQSRFRDRARAVALIGGLAPWAHEALGPGWLELDGMGGNVETAAVSTEQLAQRTLGDVFENLARMAETGRDKCRGGVTYNYEPVPVDKLIQQREADRLLSLMEHALDYAREQIAYLAHVANENGLGFTKGEHVAVCRPDDERTWLGVVVRYVEGDLEVQAEDASLQLVPPQCARKAAV